MLGVEVFDILMLGLDNLAASWGDHLEVTVSYTKHSVTIGVCGEESMLTIFYAVASLVCTKHRISAGVGMLAKNLINMWALHTPPPLLLCHKLLIHSVNSACLHNLLPAGYCAKSH